MNHIAPITEATQRTPRQHIYSALRELQVRARWVEESAGILNATPHFPICEQLRKDRRERLDEAVANLEEAIAEFRHA